MNISNLTMIYDGEIHRFHVPEDKANTRNGWYIAKPNGWAVYGTWKEGDSRYYINKDGTTLSLEDQKAFKKDLALQKRLRCLQQEKTAKLLAPNYENATSSAHPYLAKKGFPYFEEKVHNGVLLIPVCDISMNYNKIISLQYIWPDGSKRFASGCRTKGGMHMIAPENVDNVETIYLCEGYATALTVSIATKSMAAICFYASNIMHACDILQRRFSQYKVIICADNDINTPGNPGVTEAIKAAKKHDLGIIVPNIAGCDDKATDFNDIMNQVSIDEVRRQILT